MFWFFALFSNLTFASHPFIAFENVPPYAYVEQGRVKGLYVQKVSRVFSIADVNFNSEVYPWARAINRTSKHANKFLVNLAMMPERKDKFIWLGQFDIYCPAVMRLDKRNDIELSHENDIRNYRMVLLRDYFISLQVQKDDLIDQGNIIWVATLQEAYELMLKERVDLAIFDPHRLTLMMQHLGDKNQLTMALPLPQYNQPLNLAANLLTDASIVQRLKSALEQYNASPQRQRKLRTRC